MYITYPNSLKKNRHTGFPHGRKLFSHPIIKAPPKEGEKKQILRHLVERRSN